MKSVAGVLLAIVALGGAIALACGGSGSDRPERPTLSRSDAEEATETVAARRTEHAGERVTATVLAADADADGFIDQEDECPEDAEDEEPAWLETDGCPDSVDDLLTLAREDIEGYWEGVFEEDDLEYTPPNDFVAYTEEEDTPCGPTLLGNAFYCPPDHTIYYDLNLVIDLVTRKGDFGAAFLVAHEWAHLVQANLGILDDATLTIQVELQADCFAGMWAKDADDRGLLDEGDFDEAVSTLFAFGDTIETAWFETGAHGSPGQRIDAFRLGYIVGPDGCNNPFEDIVPFNPTATPEETATPTRRPPRQVPTPDGR